MTMKNLSKVAVENALTFYNIIKKKYKKHFYSLKVQGE